MSAPQPPIFSTEGRVAESNNNRNSSSTSNTININTTDGQQQQRQEGVAAVEQQEEDVLRDVLDELDRERSRRAELEVNLRNLTEKHDVLQESYQAAMAQVMEQAEMIKMLQSQAVVAAKTEQEDQKDVTRRVFLAMETQVKEFQNLIDVLTKGRPAIAAAASAGETNTTTAFQKQQRGKSKNLSKNQLTKVPSLPLYVVRLLEILPWTPHAQEHVFGREEIYEWQFYDLRDRQWICHLRGFPQSFKSLPVVGAKAGKGIIGDGAKEKDRGLLFFLAGGAGPVAPLRHGVFTDEPMTYVLSIADGYPLPEDGGTWEWIGGWTIEKRISSRNGSPTSLKQRVDCDELGWSYAQDAEFFKVNPTEGVWDNPGELDEVNKTGFLRKLRRRKWTRRRVLVDYPFASEQTKEYLKLLAENARLTVTSNKISDQLVETKTALTYNEEVLMQEKGEAAAELKRLREELQMKTELLRAAGIDVAPQNRSGSTGNPMQELLKHEKDIVSKFSRWVKSNSRIGDANSPTPVGRSGSNEILASSLTPSSDPVDETLEHDNTKQGGGFDWKKVGRASNFFDKLKGQPPSHADQDKNSDGRKSGIAADKLGKQAGRATGNSSEGSLTDESTDDVIEIPETAA